MIAGGSKTTSLWLSQADGVGDGVGICSYMGPILGGMKHQKMYGQFEGFLVGVGNRMIPVVARFLELKGF